jgi:hypothetical protein
VLMETCLERSLCKSGKKRDAVMVKLKKCRRFEQAVHVLGLSLGDGHNCVREGRILYF